MQIKKYEAVDMPSAIQMIKKELGPEAVILSTRQIRRGKGSFGLFGRPMVEVTAAVDFQAGEERKKKDDESLDWMRGRSTRRLREDFPLWLQPLKQDLQEIREEMDLLRTCRSDPPEMRDLLVELNSFRQVIQSCLQQDAGDRFRDYPASFQKIGRRLIAQDVDPHIVEKLLRGVRDRLSHERFETERKLETTLERILKNLLPVQGGIRVEKPGPRKVALIGPTGVGKTTTLAKIAAEYALNQKLKVALITVDTYRIAAIEQLKIYAKIIGIPVEVVIRSEDLNRSFRKYKGYDLILIDTAGRNHRNGSQIRELKDVFAGWKDIEMHLVLSAVTKQADLIHMIQNFNSLDYQYLLFTKIDEGSRFGTILNGVLQSGKAVSYLTDGQRVPEDIRKATGDDLARLILPSDRVGRSFSSELQRVGESGSHRVVMETGVM